MFLNSSFREMNQPCDSPYKRHNQQTQGLWAFPGVHVIIIQPGVKQSEDSSQRMAWTKSFCKQSICVLFEICSGTLVTSKEDHSAFVKVTICHPLIPDEMSDFWTFSVEASVLWYTVTRGLQRYIHLFQNSKIFFK